MSIFKSERIAEVFSKHFSFESNVNLSDEVEVLFRRNVVIKNIMFISNIVYSILLFVVTFGSSDPGSWLFTAIPFPITFLINRTIKKLIHNDKTNLVTQQVAMYLSAFYMFLSAILIYIKLETSSNNFLSQSGYMLLFYALIVVSLYQNKVMLKRVFAWMLCIVTVLHVFITHKIYEMDYSSSVFSFIKEFPVSSEGKDIVFRTIIMLCFMLVVYSICAIGEKITTARTEELSKRQEIQDDFTKIVSNLFDVLIKSNNSDEQSPEDTKILYDTTEKLASIFGYDPKKCTELAEYSKFLIEHKDDFKIDSEFENNDSAFEHLRTQSKLGTQLVKRIELSQKTVTIIRSHLEGNGSPNFVNIMNKVQKNNDADILLLADIYVTLRSIQSYKRPYNHKTAIEKIQSIFSVYFDQKLIERFVNFEHEFEIIYDGR